ncbi:hypothetical protein [Terrabacter sp. MAHUQ-38]|uniref:hypothetical protein n=1 Tax=unclassified Terrabacter TaxID=2630222 RepID=UPI00165E8A5A|nr:hypothetical protein [Terrabacter sp. MAHUQ-38]MBC9823645.1 hypothetical protein [Terrabacter sp. MAHUQ-38]
MMLVDCQTCPVRDVHCSECMVTALTAIPMRPGSSGGAVDAVTAPLDRAERRAVSALLAAGLVTTATANAARAQLDDVERAPGHRARRAV